MGEMVSLMATSGRLMRDDQMDSIGNFRAGQTASVA
jgi:hypothetical protein